MKIRHWFASGVLACAQLSAMAQQAPEQPHPQDADAAVPALTYASAFEGFSSANTDPDRTPDQAWRPANDQLTKPDAGHAHQDPKQEGKAPSPPTDAQPKKHEHQHESK